MVTWCRSGSSTSSSIFEVSRFKKWPESTATAAERGDLFPFLYFSNLNTDDLVHMSLIKLCNQWPGGVPSYIRRHEQPEDDVISATRAWRHFVREQWTDSVPADQQRRALIERWVTADQELRDVSFTLKKLRISSISPREQALSLILYLEL